MKKNNKKGFTIVELVIVIAVIGVLAAILIPTFINLNNKAKVANTTSFLKNVNTQIAAKEANHDIDDFAAQYDEKGRFATNGNAKEYAKQRLGYDFDLISPFNGNEICWDENNKKFGLIDYSDEANPVEVYADVKVEEHKWQRLSNDPVQTKGILQRGDSLTLKDNFSKEDLTELGSDYYDPTTETLKVNGTIELGNNPNVKAVEYKNTGAAKDVIIQTNSVNVDLTIDAPLDTVDHYGSVGNVDAQRIDLNHCYNEYGKAAYVKITEGKVVAKAGGEISVVFAANNDGEKVAVIKESNATITKGLTAIEPVSTTNEARINGIALEYSIDGTTAASMSEEAKAEALVNREVVANEQAEAAVEVNLIEEVEASGLYEARIGTTGYATFDEAASSILSGETLVLLKDVVRVETVSVAVWDKPFNIDLNSHTYETLSDVDITLGNNGYKASAFCFAYDGTTEVTIKNGTIKTKYGAPVYAASKTVILENVVLYQDHNNYVQTTKEYSSAVRSTGGAVVINSGTYEGYYVLAASNTGGEYTVNGGTFNGALFFSSSTNSGVIKSFTINGGTFNSFEVINPTKGTVSISGGTFDADPSAYVVSGYHANNNGNGTWTVVAD